MYMELIAFSDEIKVEQTMGYGLFAIQCGRANREKKSRETRHPPLSSLVPR